MQPLESYCRAVCSRSTALHDPSRAEAGSEVNEWTGLSQRENSTMRLMTNSRRIVCAFGGKSNES
jgi:hypothetical protein